MFAAGAAVYFTGQVIEKVAPTGEFSEAIWLTIGVVVGGLITWVTQPDASKSELSEYVHAELEADAK